MQEADPEALRLGVIPGRIADSAAWSAALVVATWFDLITEEMMRSLHSLRRAYPGHPPGRSWASAGWLWCGGFLLTACVASGPVLRGKVTDSAGRPLPRAYVELRSRSAGVLEVESCGDTSTTGLFECNKWPSGNPRAGDTVEVMLKKTGYVVRPYPLVLPFTGELQFSLELEVGTPVPDDGVIQEDQRGSTGGARPPVR